MEKKKDIDFLIFLLIWNRQQNLVTPEIHIKIAKWLERKWNEGDKRIVLMAFRSAGKSTLVGLFAAWILYKNPNLRILVLAADFVLARKMVRNVKRVIERHPATKGMKPKNPDQWASDFFTVNRDLELRDPSILARGVTSNITGSRADVVICDDVEVPNTCDTAEKREELRTRLREMSYVLVAGGVQIYVGTPHHYFSIYADAPRKEVGEEEPFLSDFSRMSLPIMDEFGDIAWPARYTAESIERMRRDTGPNKFDSQMMLKAVNIMDSRFNVELLQYYNQTIEYNQVLGKYMLGHMEMTRRIGFWDPSTASNKGDDSVFAVLLSGVGEEYFLHHVEYIKVNAGDKQSELVQQCRTVAELARRYFLKLVQVEDNGMGKYLPSALGIQMNQISPTTSVQAVTNSRSKMHRIIEAFDAPLAARRLYVHEQILKTPFVMEMREWRPNGKGRDDALDAAAGALAFMPDTANRQGFSGAQIRQARTDFDV